MNDTEIPENLKGLKALRRERKKRQRMQQHGRALKKRIDRAVRHIAKVNKKK